MSRPIALYNDESSRRYRVRFSSTKENIPRAEEFIASIEECCHLSQQKYFDLVIALTEAVNNAIVHGNKSDAQKYVDVEAEVTANSIIFSVKDQGEGFDPQSIPDPRSPENLLKSSGRGIFLIRELSDYCEIGGMPFGSQVSMAFFRENIS